jgi:hypothetical protein
MDFSEYEISTSQGLDNKFQVSKKKEIFPMPILKCLSSYLDKQILNFVVKHFTFRNHTDKRLF